VRKNIVCDVGQKMKYFLKLTLKAWHHDHIGKMFNSIKLLRYKACLQISINRAFWRYLRWFLYKPMYEYLRTYFQDTRQCGKRDVATRILFEWRKLRNRSIRFWRLIRKTSCLLSSFLHFEVGGIRTIDRYFLFVKSRFHSLKKCCGR